MTFQEMLKERLSPTDWQRMQAFIGSMGPEQRAAMMQFIAQRETHAPAVGDEAPDFELPRLDHGGENPWRRWIDTALESPHDIVDWEAAQLVPGYAYRAESRSVVVLFAGV